MAVTPGSGVTVTRVVSPAPRPLWSDVLAQDPLSLPDQAPDWTDAIVAAEPWADASRFYELADGSAVVLPLLRHRRMPRSFASLPYGWGFGGLVGLRANDPAVIADVLGDLVEMHPLRLRLRANPLGGDVWAASCPVRPHRVLRSRAHVLDLRPGPEALWASVKKETRRHIRRCVAFDLDVEVGSGGQFIEAYQQLRRLSVTRWAERTHEPLWLAVPRAQLAEPPRHMYSLAERLGYRYRMWVVRIDGQPVAANVVAFGRNAHATRAAMDRERVGSLGVMAYLDWLAIKDACAAGAQWYHLGDSGTSAPLATYKEGLGAAAHGYAEVRFEPAGWTAIDSGSRRIVKRALGFVD